MNNIRFMEIAPDQKHELRMDAQSHFGTFEVKNDATLWQKVNKLAHSTFDLSKFNVVGSPNITDDGIASGFSGSNYLKKSNLFTVDETYTQVDIYFPFKYTGSANNKIAELKTNDNNNKLVYSWNATDNKLIAITRANATNYILGTADGSLIVGHKYLVHHVVLYICTI